MAMKREKWSILGFKRANYESNRDFQPENSRFVIEMADLNRKWLILSQKWLFRVENYDFWN